MLHAGRRGSLLAYLAQWAVLNALFLLIIWWIGYPVQAMVWVPAILLRLSTTLKIVLRFQ